MEKLICENEFLEFKFYCVQPIQIKNIDLIKLFNKKITIEKLDKYVINIEPSWFNNFNKELYSNMKVLNIDSNIEEDLLKNQLKNEFKVNNNSLSDYLLSCNCYVLYDFKLMYFNLFFELTFKFDVLNINKYLQCVNNKEDLYNSIRNILVKENDNDLESLWAIKIKLKVLNKIRIFLEEVYGYKLSDRSIYIENNTGNITNLVYFNINDKLIINQLSKSILELNNIAERVTNFKKPIMLSYLESYENKEVDYNSELYYFNGRFHTIIIHNYKDIFRYIPIQVHMQYMWFYLKKINGILESQYNEIMNEEKIKNITIHSKMIDNLINKIEVLTMHNEKFKLVIEGDNEFIYKHIQANWNIENMLINSNRYINYFKDYLNRVYTEQTSKVEQRQNKILLFISIFQFATLISVWNDYVSLLDKDIEKKAKNILPLFLNQYENLEKLNLYLPLIFSFFILLMIFYINKKD